MLSSFKQTHLYTFRLFIVKYHILTFYDVKLQHHTKTHFNLLENKQHENPQECEGSCYPFSSGKGKKNYNTTSMPETLRNM